jgi:hypothetical protein
MKEEMKNKRILLAYDGEYDITHSFKVCLEEGGIESQFI